MKTAKLSEEAQRFMMPQPKPYYIKELRATIFAKDDEEFEQKKHKLIEGRKRFTGGNSGKPTEIKDYGLYFKEK